MFVKKCKALLLLALLPSFICQAQVASTSHDKRYQLHPGDTVSLDYRYSPEYNTSALVQPDGYATFPLLGQVHIAGLTLDQVQILLLTKASERLNDPEINLSLKDTEKPFYVVGGEVGAPGRFEIRGRITALRAVEIAGGFKPFCKATQVLVIRPINGIDGRTFVVDLKRVVDKKDLAADMELQPGDLLIVPKSRFGKIEPYIHLVNTGVYYNPTSF